MLGAFLNNNLCIELTKNDIPLLKELQNMLGDMTWSSKHNIDSDTTRNYIEEYGSIYIYCDDTWNKKHSIFYYESLREAKTMGNRNMFTTLPDFLYSSKSIKIEETEMDDILKYDKEN